MYLSLKWDNPPNGKDPVRRHGPYHRILNAGVRVSTIAPPSLVELAINGAINDQDFVPA